MLNFNSKICLAFAVNYLEPKDNNTCEASMLTGFDHNPFSNSTKYFRKLENAKWFLESAKSRFIIECCPSYLHRLDRAYFNIKLKLVRTRRSINERQRLF